MDVQISALLCVFLLCGILSSIQAERRSLYYIYTALSKPVDLPGIYEFTAMGLLDDRQIDYYNSKDKIKIPKQHWMKEKMQEDYWEKGTQSRKSKEQWFNVNVNILMNRMRQDNSDLHVLQWRVGCEVEQQGDKVTFLKGVSEYGYDGEHFLSFDDKESRWVAPVEAALPTMIKWDNVPILNQFTKGYLEKECVDWLNIFREYGDEELRNGSPPDVHMFAKSIRNRSKLKLTCLATGFYPKDVRMTIRKYRSSLPEDEIESSGIRPNHDGSFQMRKSVEITEDEKAEYDCFVSHRTLREPITVKWDGKCQHCQPVTVPVMIGAVIGGVMVLAVAALVLFILKKRMVKMRLLVIFALLVFSFPSVMAEVVDSFSKCSDFFIKNEPPEIEGVLKNSVSQDEDRYKLICQKYDEQYRFATLYDIREKIPVFSAYKFTDIYKGKPHIQWMTEPQLEPLDGEMCQVPIRLYQETTGTRRHWIVDTCFPTVTQLMKSMLNPHTHRPTVCHKRAASTPLKKMDQKESLITVYELMRNPRLVLKQQFNP